MPAKSKKKKAPIITAPKGMHDSLPADQPLWEKIKKHIKEVADSYNFMRIDTPLIEKFELFTRPLGESSDVVEKEMFTLKTKGGDTLVLRPEGTAPVVRAYIEHGLSHLGQPVKLYYQGPMFRYQQPQQGRAREFYQAGFEIISNDNDPIYDAQIILACYRLLESLKIKDLDLQINTIGCARCRPNYRRILIEYYRTKEKKLCVDCKRRLKINPMRLLDCKNAQCQEFKTDAPNVLDHLCSDCKKHLKKVLEYLEEARLSYTINQFLVRGFDYYSKTVFEIFSKGFNSALAGGGRYDYLIEMLGGRSTNGVGGAVGITPTLEVIKSQGINLIGKPKSKVYLIHIGDAAKAKAIGLVETFRNAGINIMESLGKDSLRAQLKSADKSKAALALIFGQQEAFEQSIIVRDMQTGAQETVPLKNIVEVVKRKLK